MLLIYLWSIHGMLLLLHVDLDVCIANKGEKIEVNKTQIRGSFCIALPLNMFLKGGESCKGVNFNSTYFQGEFALIVFALLHFACIQGEFAPQLCFEFELCAFC